MTRMARNHYLCGPVPGEGCSGFVAVFLERNTGTYQRYFSCSRYWTHVQDSAELPMKFVQLTYLLKMQTPFSLGNSKQP